MSFKGALTGVVLGVAVTAAADMAVLKAPNGVGERCQLLSAFPFTPRDVESDNWYLDRDFRKIRELCELDLYGAPATGVCPKIHGSMPALELYDLRESGIGKRSFEQERCRISGKSKPGAENPLGATKVAKFKASTYIAESESALLYFHFSRLLGNIGLTLPVTYREVAVSEHKKWATFAIDVLTELAPKKSPLEGWQALLSAENSSRARPRLFVDGARERIYGALAENIRGEVEHEAFYMPGAGVTEKMAAYRTKRFFQVLATERPLRELLALDSRDAKTLASELQQLVYARDFAHMALLDTLFAQFDRMGNIAQKRYYHSKGADGRVELTSEKPAGKTSVALWRMILEDNDDALVFSKPSPWEQEGLLGDIRHLDRVTYDRIQWLAALMSAPESAARVKQYFREIAHISDGTYETVRGRFLEIAQRMATLERQGRLYLDLDLEKVLK